MALNTKNKILFNSQNSYTYIGLNHCLISIGFDSKINIRVDKSIFRELILKFDAILGSVTKSNSISICEPLETAVFVSATYNPEDRIFHLKIFSPEAIYLEIHNYQDFLDFLLVLKRLLVFTITRNPALVLALKNFILQIVNKSKDIEQLTIEIGKFGDLHFIKNQEMCSTFEELKLICHFHAESLINYAILHLIMGESRSENSVSTNINIMDELLIGFGKVFRK